MKNKFKKLLLTTDAISVVIAMFTAYYIRNDILINYNLDRIQPLGVYARALPFALIALLLVFLINRIYDLDVRKNSLTEVYKIIKSLFVWTLLIMSAAYLYKYDYSRILLFLFFAFAGFYLLILRGLVRKLESYYYHRGEGMSKILIIGANRRGREIYRNLQEYKNVGMEVLGFIDDNAKNRKNYPIVGKVSDLSELVMNRKISEIYFTDPRMSHDEILNIISKLKDQEVSFKISLNVLDLYVGRFNMMETESFPSIDITGPKDYWWFSYTKRIFDITSAIIILIILFPLMIYIFLKILLEDGQPVLLKQKRVGKEGKLFTLYKFRTMKKNTNKYADAPRSSKDNRITNFGRKLRRTSLDELPQLMNILKGEMSLVGPRPELPNKTKNYTLWQKDRFSVKPGLTGLWQILGRKELNLQDNLEYDFYYINNRSFLLDLTILIRTIPSVLSGKGAF